MSTAALETTIPRNGAAAAVQSLAERVAALEAQLAEVQSRLPKDKVTIVVFSGDLDRVLAAFIIASGAATVGQEVSMFFTFWGLNALRRQRKLRGKKLTEKMMALMTPANTKGMGVSKLNFFGIGALMLRQMMKEKNVTSVEELIDLCTQLGVRMVSCEMSRDVMGIDPEELQPQAEVGGVAAYLADALESRITLFI
jgi:peroxiredoxin family protein